MASPVKQLTFLLLIYHMTEHYRADGGHVLFIPLPSANHFGNALHIARALADNHHHRSSVIIPARVAIHPLLVNTSVETILSEGIDKVDVETIGMTMFDETISAFSKMSSLSSVFQLCDSILRDENLLIQLQKIHFDIAVIDMSLIDPCIATLPYKLSIPFVKLARQPMWMMERIPQVPSVTPTSILLQFTDDMSFVERFINTFIHGVLLIAPNMFIPYNVVDKYAPGRPFLTNEELNARTELMLIDQEILMDYQMPLYQNQILVGGLSTYPPRPLPREISEFMESATNGVVLVSFGSILTHIPTRFLIILMDTFKRLSDLKFIFKSEIIPENVENTLALPWLPQNDILGHNNTKLFITHCGSNGLYEALYHGVPLIGIPVGHDQPTNAGMLQKRGYGVMLHPTNTTTDAVEWAIREVLENAKYKSNIAKASRIIKSRPDSSRDRAAYWINHVMAHGGSYLRPKSATIPYYQYILLDVFLAMLVVFLLLVCVCKYCCGMVFHKHTTVCAKVKSE